MCELQQVKGIGLALLWALALGSAPGCESSDPEPSETGEGEGEGGGVGEGEGEGEGACSPQPEICNELDDDCDGQTDEGFPQGQVCTVGVGACQVEGRTVCLESGQAGCDAQPGVPTAETCNELDDDCNGVVDDTGALERCNGQDDDCDGQTDEELGLGAECVMGVGGCRVVGVQICAADGSGQVVCNVQAGTPQAETCNGLDDDCDGEVDNLAAGCDCPDGARQACGSDVGTCTLGEQTCVDGRWGACAGGVGPTAERCNNLDDDCNGTVDDRAAGPCACLDGTEQPCGLSVGSCQPGTQTCTEGAWGECQGGTPPAAEVCDGLDNDCDGQTDEELPGTGDECRVGQGVCAAVGSLVCDAASGELQCDAQAGIPADEVCDGLDNDCDGVVDNLADPGCGCVDGEVQPCCDAAATDYLPPAGGIEDSWPACAADGDPDTWVPFDPNISTIARIAAFEAIADLLWRGGAPPGSQAFIDARLAYTLAEGLESRVTRREDEHYPAAVDANGAAAACTVAGVPALNPDRCAGPAKIAPLLNDAFVKGIEGTTPLVQAARLEAGLLWFLYISPYKEARTCYKAKKDCDSAYAYYTGGADRDGEALGLARYVQEVRPAAHDRIWDGLLAVHCWRDLDPAATAENLPLRDQAVGQLDQALHHAVSGLVLARLPQLNGPAGEARDAAWAFVQILGGALVREAKLRDAAAGASLEQELARPAPTEQSTAVLDDLLDALFPCP